MERIIKKLKEKVFRKVFWLPGSQIKIIERETKRLKLPNDSALMRTIISNMFEK